MTLLAESHGAQVHHCDWRALLDVVPECDALIVDAPYSERTHAGHDGGVAKPARAERGIVNRSTGQIEQGWHRRAITYSFWTAGDVTSFSSAWSPRTRGWIASVTDHVLAPVWADALEREGRYVFAPLPFVAPGSRVRLTGDGPSAWTCWIVVARPKSRTYSTWGTLPGAYVLPPGQAHRMPVVGGKPIWLMQRLVEDYSRPGDLVVDPCCGAGTTLVGAIRAGRRAIGGDVSEAHAGLAAKWISNPERPAPGIEREAGEGQLAMFGAAK